jgi:Stage II sporulation protein E (SpoIIE)
MSASRPAAEPVPATFGTGQSARSPVRPLAAARRRWVHLVSVIAAVVGLAVTGVLVWLSASASTRTQHHLLQTQATEAGQILGEVVPTIQTPLLTSAAIADVDRGATAPIRRYISHDVGTTTGTLFTSVSVWRLGPAGPTQILRMGSAPKLAAQPRRLRAFFTGISKPETLAAENLLAGAHPRIGFAVESVGTVPRYVVYAELAVPASRQAHVPASSAFNQLNFALYLGNRPIRANLIEATVATLPLRGGTSVLIPFGSSHLDFVAAASGPLGGGLLPALPWIVGAVGLALTASGVWTAEWLMRRRRMAEALAVENHRLYAEQRSIAQALQRSLLPADLPRLAGMDLAARYLPGDPAADIGGDWYDVIRCDARSAIFAVGDVSGRGIPAANTMASLHFAIRAYAAQGDDAPTILRKLTELLDIARDGHFATVLLGHVDVQEHRLTLASAGHPPALVISERGAEFVTAPPGTPIGVTPGCSYSPVTIVVPPRSSVLAYTDGLVERRGELLDVGLERLRAAAIEHGEVTRAATLLDTVARTLATSTHADDVALLALRWTN